MPADASYATETVSSSGITTLQSSFNIFKEKSSQNSKSDSKNELVSFNLKSLSKSGQCDFLRQMKPLQVFPLPQPVRRQNLLQDQYL